MKTNKEKCVMQSVIGSIHSPTVRGNGVNVSVQGKSFVLPSVGGICYNVKVGDSVYGLMGDHIEPGVSIRNSDLQENGALNALSCIGNAAYVMSGDSKGSKGVVTGTHGGIEHVLVYFDDQTLEKLCIGDKIQVRAFGQGLEIEGCPDIKVLNCSPELLEKLGAVQEGDTLRVPVVAEVPAYLMGSGLGSQAASGDYDIMTADKEALRQFGLENLRFGDLVFLRDCDNVYGRGYLKDACVVGVVVHSDCMVAGHGPGVTTLFACKTAKIKPVIDPNANIGKYLGLID